MPNTITDGRQLWRGNMVPLSRRGKVVGVTDERGPVSATGAGTAATADGGRQTRLQSIGLVLRSCRRSICRDGA
jgi:hypothetical protein